MKASGDQRKTSADLVPKFYWKRRNVQPFIPYEELKAVPVDPTEEDDTMLSTLKEETAPDEEEKQKGPPLLHLMTAVEKRREQDLIMNRFSNNQKELIRQMGGLPKRTLTAASETFKRSVTVQSGAPVKNPFKINKEILEAQLNQSMQNQQSTTPAKSRAAAVATTRIVNT